MASAVFAWRRSSSRSRPTRPHRPIPISTPSFASGEPPPPTTISLIPLPPSGQRSPVPSVWPNRRRPNSHSSVRIRTSPTHGRPGARHRSHGDRPTHRRSLPRQHIGTLDAPLWWALLRHRSDAALGSRRRGKRGGTINDLYVTALADAAIAYHAERGTEPRSVAMSFVRSTRTGSGAGGNAFVPIKVRAPGQASLPTSASLHSATRWHRLMPPTVSPASARQRTRRPHPDAGADSPRPRPGRPDRRCHQQYSRAPVPIFVGDAHVLGTFPIGPVPAPPATQP